MIHLKRKMPSNKKKTKTNTTRRDIHNKEFFLLFFLYLIAVIPVIAVYLEHANVEIKAHSEAQTETKKIKTYAEALLFASIAVGYIIVTIFIFLYPNNPIPYLVVIVGTIAIVILYYLRLYGIPIPFTEGGIVITDLSSDWRDAITKIFQTILVVPITAMLVLQHIKTRKSLGATTTT